MMLQEQREICNLVHSAPRRHAFGARSRHWQLKDMLKMHKGCLVFPSSSDIVSYNLETGISERIYEGTEFFPTSLSIEGRFLAVGGSRGQIGIKNLETGEMHFKTVGMSINNNVHIHKDRILVCSNDRILKIFTTEMREVARVEHVVQVNNCAMSPDGRFLIIVGDSEDVLLYSVLGDKLALVKRLRGGGHGGFGVSWNSTSSLFAVGTQDGLLYLWDVRSDNVLHKIESKQRDPHRRAIRSVKFSLRNSLDLLVFTEHLSYVNVCDTRELWRCQRMKVWEDGQITGMVFSEENDKLFVSTGDEIVEFTVDLRSRRMSPSMWIEKDL